MHARLVRPDATTGVIDLPADPGEALAVLRTALDCQYVEAVHVTVPCPGAPGVTIWADEEGLLAGSPVINPAAAQIVAVLSGREPGQPFADPVLFTGGPGPGGETTPLPETPDQVITQVAAAVREAIGQAGTHAAREGI
jgi:hypothetical protein